MGNCSRRRSKPPRTSRSSAVSISPDRTSANQALIAGRIDAYVEYTGTALTGILKQPLPHSTNRDSTNGDSKNEDPNSDRSPRQVLDTVRRLYAAKYHVTVGPPLGFEQLIRDDHSRRRRVPPASRHPLSQAAQYTPHWKLGVGYEFEQRPDGLPGLSAAYGLKFAGPPRTMDLGLLYRALNAHQVDMIAGNTTDGPIQAFGLTVLEDDKHYFPPYQAVPLLREPRLSSAGRRFSLLSTALAGRVTADDMRAMNEAVDGQHRDPADVVREFRKKKGL